MAVLYISAGIYHFVRPWFYKTMMPHWLPWHIQLVFISGICEIILGILLFPQATRGMAAWGIIVLLIVIFPANIQMMLSFKRKRNPYLWIAVLRLPLQLLLIWWAWQYTV